MVDTARDLAPHRAAPRADPVCARGPRRFAAAGGGERWASVRAAAVAAADREGRATARAHPAARTRLRVARVPGRPAVDVLARHDRRRRRRGPPRARRRGAARRRVVRRDGRAPRRRAPPGARDRARAARQRPRLLDGGQAVRAAADRLRGRGATSPVSSTALPRCSAGGGRTRCSGSARARSARVFPS